MASFPKRRVVVTGLGVISPLGTGIQENWDALIHGKSGIDRISKFDASRLDSQIAGEVRNCDINQYLSPKETRRYDPFLHWGVAAAQLAMEDAQLTVTDALSERLGVIIGSGIGGLQSIVETQHVIDERHPNRISPFFILQAIGNTISGFVSIRYHAKGPNSCVVTACATGAHAIGDAFRHIQLGHADAMIAGGADAVICELAVGGFCAMKALSTQNDEPKKASRPFDKNRDGFVIAEGAGVLILEELELAKKRGAKICGEVIGYGMSGDANHLTSPTPDGDGAARCMKIAIQDAEICPEEIDYINAHGTSTPAGDIAETNAIKKVFQSIAKTVSVSSTKSMTGHMLGAAGSAEAIYTLLAMQHGIIPPTINLEDPDPACDLDYTPKHAKEKKMKTVLSNSFGFGGTNASLIFRSFS